MNTWSTTRLVALTAAVGIALILVTLVLAADQAGGSERPYEGGTYERLDWRASSGWRGDQTGGYWLDFDPRATVVDLRSACDANPLEIVPVAAAPDTPGDTTRLLVRCPTLDDDG